MNTRKSANPDRKASPPDDHPTLPIPRRRSAGYAAACCAGLILTLPSPATALGREAGRLEPAVEGRIPAKVRFVLSSAYSIALSRLHHVESCAGLFSALGADGLEQLSGSVFLLASPEQEQRICRGRKSDAFTQVGGTRVGLCVGFTRLTRLEAAVRLIHEALHHAGMTEKPVDPAALSSREINQLVKASCEL
jgi:hypothetical protein